jgi:hypothetical protein
MNAAKAPVAVLTKARTRQPDCSMREKWPAYSTLIAASTCHKGHVLQSAKPHLPTAVFRSAFARSKATHFSALLQRHAPMPRVRHLRQRPPRDGDGFSRWRPRRLLTVDADTPNPVELRLPKPSGAPSPETLQQSIEADGFKQTVCRPLGWVGNGAERTGFYGISSRILSIEALPQRNALGRV